MTLDGGKRAAAEGAFGNAAESAAKTEDEKKETDETLMIG